MAVNKVSFYGDTLLDISDTTADESSVVKGKVFYKANGARAVGTADYQPKIFTQVVNLTANWLGSDPYYQTVLTDQEANAQIDLQFTVDQLKALQAAGVGIIVAENTDGTVIIRVTGAKPTSAMSVQITKTLIEEA